MEKRNQLSVAIISLIIIAGAIATPIMVNDFEGIIDDFLNSPFLPPELPLEGILNLYYTSDYTEENSTPLPDYFPAIQSTNETELVTRIWIYIVDITFLGKRVGNSQFFSGDDVFDVLDGYNETTLLKSGNITAAEYAGIQITFNSTIYINTNLHVSEEEAYSFEFQGNPVITVPFNMFGSLINDKVDLDIIENTVNSILLDLSFEILWPNSTVRVTSKAYIL